MAITYGLDLTTNTSYATSYSGYFVSPLYTVGSNLHTFKFYEIEFQFDRPLAANEGVKLEYRTSLSGSYTTVITCDNTTYGAVASKNFPNKLPELTAVIPDCEQIQFRVSLTGTTTTNYLKRVILH